MFVVVTVSCTGVPDCRVAVFGVIRTLKSVGAMPGGTATVEVLFAALGSVTFAGTVTLAVFAIVADVPCFGVPITVNTTWPPDAMDTDWSIAPVPEAVHEPETAAHVHFTPVRLAGTTSRTRAPVTSSGPWFATVTVNVSAWPGRKVLVDAFFVTARSARADTTVVAVDALLPELGS